MHTFFYCDADNVAISVVFFIQPLSSFLIPIIIIYLYVWTCGLFGWRSTPNVARSRFNRKKYIFPYRQFVRFFSHSLSHRSYYKTNYAQSGARHTQNDIEKL